MMMPWVDEKTHQISCPVHGWECPYYIAEDGSCILRNVEDNCDDFYAFWEDEIDEWYQNKFNGALLLEKQIMEG